MSTHIEKHQSMYPVLDAAATTFLDTPSLEAPVNSLATAMGSIKSEDDRTSITHMLLCIFHELFGDVPHEVSLVTSVSHVLITISRTDLEVERPIYRCRPRFADVARLHIHDGFVSLIYGLEDKPHRLGILATEWMRDNQYVTVKSIYRYLLDYMGRLEGDGEYLTDMQLFNTLGRLRANMGDPVSHRGYVINDVGVDAGIQIITLIRNAIKVRRYSNMDLVGADTFFEKRSRTQLHCPEKYKATIHKHRCYTELLALFMVRVFWRISRNVFVGK